MTRGWLAIAGRWLLPPPPPLLPPQATIIGSSTNDGRLRCVFILPAGEHAALERGGAAAYEAFMRSTFPSLPEDAIQVAGWLSGRLAGWLAG